MMVFSLLSSRVLAQLLPGPTAYLLFEDKNSGSKFEYLYPEMVQNQKLTDWQNKAYAKLGVQSVITLKETTKTKDTIGIRKFNPDGFIIARDSFVWNERHQKSQAIWRYDYSSSGKEVREITQLTALEPEFYLFNKNENLFYYDDKNLLVKVKGAGIGSDTSLAYFEYYPNGIMKGYKRHHALTGGSKDLNSDGEHEYRYEFDIKGRVTNYEATGLVYDDRNHCIRFFNGEKCYQTYYLTKKSHIVQAYCCPLSNEDVKRNSHSKTTTIFDNRSRIKSVTEANEYREKPCEDDGPAYRVTRYKYNQSGLLSEVSMDGTGEKISFHYFDKNKREIR